MFDICAYPYILKTFQLKTYTLTYFYYNLSLSKLKTIEKISVDIDNSKRPIIVRDVP